MKQNLIALGLLVVFFTLSMLSVRKLDLTTDELNHYRYGMNILLGDSDRFDDSKMPVSALNAIPARVADFLPDSMILQTYLRKFVVARLITTLFSVSVAVVIFIWARKLYGDTAGFLALSLYIFDPNIIAHSQLVTTDIYAAGTILFATFWLWKYANQRSFRNGLICAFFLGLSLVAKYTSVVLLPLFVLALVIYDWLNAKKTENLAKILQWIVLAGVVCLLVINIAFLFNRSFAKLEDYRFRSELFEQLRAVPVLRSLLIPVPYPFLQGLDWVYAREQSGEGYGRIYLLGELRENQGFAGYYFVAFLLKVPIATQIIIGLSFLALFMKRHYENIRRDELFLFIPIIFFVIYFNFLYKAQIGLRFYLVIFPLLFVFAGGLLKDWLSFNAVQKRAFDLLCIYLVVSTLSYYPHFLTYFNEIVWNRKTAYKYLADSNIDWGQGGLYLREYLVANPDVFRAPSYPEPGTFIISVNDLVGIWTWKEADTFSWLRNNFTPVGSVANQYLIFEITPEAYNALCDTTVYCQ